MTSDGISSADWDRVRELAVDVVNSSDDANDRNAAKRALRDFIGELRARYGEKPSLAATEADYADSPQESEALLLRAFDLAMELSDLQNLKEVALSLAGLYIDDFGDIGRAKTWLDVARQWVQPDSDADWDEYLVLERAIATGTRRW